MQGIAQKILAAPNKYSVQELTQAVRDGVLPAYIGVPIIQSKVQEQKQMQMAQQAQGAQPNQPSIAQQVMSEAQGVEGLPTNLPQSYAGGGIVAFADNRNQPVDSNMPDTYETPYDRMNRLNRERGLQFDMSAPTDPKALADRAAMLDTINRMKAAGMDIATLPGRGVLGAAETAITRPLRALGLPVPYLPEGVYGGDRSSMTPYYDKLRAQEATTATPTPTDTTQATDTTVAPAPDKAAPTKGGGISDLLSGLGINLGGTQGAGGAGIAGVGGAPNPNLVGQTQSIIDAYNKRAGTRAADLDTKIQEANGKVTGKAYEGLEKSLQKEAEEFGADKAQAKSMAIFKAGLAMMAGTSRHALENIGKGAMVGAEDYQAAAKDIKKAQKENERAMAMVEQARRAEAIGDRDKAVEYAYKRDEALDKRDQFGTSAIANATGKSAELANDIWKTTMSAQSHLAATEMAGKYHLAGSILGAMGKERMTPYQEGRLRMEAEKRVDSDALRAQLAKSLGLSKVPAPGADKTFDAKFGTLFENEVNSHLNRFMGVPSGGAAQAGANPYAGYKIVP